MNLLNAVYRTEGNGGEVVWRITRDRTRTIEIMLVRNISRGVAVIVLPTGTDLVTARELHPEWDWLWDKVQGKFWARMCLSTDRAAGACSVWRWR